jgi:hypothetical protein
MAPICINECANYHTQNYATCYIFIIIFVSFTLVIVLAEIMEISGGTIEILLLLLKRDYIIK